MSHRDDPLLRRAALVAVAAHALILVGLPLPQADAPAPAPALRAAPPILSRYPIPPPRVAPPRASESAPRPGPRPAPPEPPPPELDPVHEPMTARTSAPPPESVDDFPLPQTPPPPALEERTIHVPDGLGVTHPVPIEASRVRPDYPEAARRARLEGQVILEVVVGADGAVGAVSVLRVRPTELGFEQAALEAVGRWRYEPATQNGVAVAVRITIVVDFTLR